jgi:hypothetical protein
MEQEFPCSTASNTGFTIGLIAKLVILSLHEASAGAITIDIPGKMRYSIDGKYI